MRLPEKMGWAYSCLFLPFSSTKTLCETGKANGITCFLCFLLPNVSTTSCWRNKQPSNIKPKKKPSLQEKQNKTKKTPRKHCHSSRGPDQVHPSKACEGLNGKRQGGFATDPQKTFLTMNNLLSKGENVSDYFHLIKSYLKRMLGSIPNILGSILACWHTLKDPASCSGSLDWKTI